MEQLERSLPPRGAFGSLLRARRQRAHLSQEQLAARAELSERTVRELEAGRVRSPRNDTVRLLADALRLTGPQRESWFAAAQNGGRPLQLLAKAEASVSARMPGSGNKPQCDHPRAAEFTAGTVLPRSHDGDAAGPVADDSGPAGPAGAVGQAPADRRLPVVGGLACADRLELAQLRRENGRLREEVEVLKRATAILAARD